MTFYFHISLAGLIAAIVALALGNTAQAINLLVYNTNNSEAGSLRQAIDDNRTLGGGNGFIFSNVVTGTITLASGELIISNNVTITGPGPNVLTVSGNNASRVFHLNATVIISGLKIAAMMALTPLLRA
jgi:hypothetical protein